MKEKIEVLVDVKGNFEPKSLITVGKSNGKSFMKVLEENIEVVPFDESFNGTSAYHYDPFYFKFVWTDGVSKFVQEHDCVWLLTMVQSYLPFISTMYAEGKDGKITFKEFARKEKYADDFQIIFFHKTGENEGYFSVESDNGEEVTTRYLQFIPYTDLEVDCVKFYLNNGVLMFPSEY